MKSFKRIIAVAGSVALMASATISSFAAAPTSEAGTANVLAYSLESVIVPSALKVALNPQGLAVTTKTDVTSTAQVVSFNYGIANLSTADKDVSVKFNVTGTADAEKTPITFVDSEEKAEYGDEDDNAKDGELKMYLAVVGSAAAPKEDASTAFAVNVKDGANDHNATAAKLADVSMSAASGGEVAFSKGADYANAEIAFKLGKSTYAVQDGQTIDWDTDQEALAGKMEITALGDITGFTFTGKMNTGADWTTADVDSLTFTPVYTITDVTGNEVATTSGGYKQIDTAPADTAPTITGATRVTGQAFDYTMTFTKGAEYTLSATGLTAVKWGNATDDITRDSANITVSDGTVTIASGMWSSIDAGGVKYLKLTIGESDYIVKVTIA